MKNQVGDCRAKIARNDIKWAYAIRPYKTEHYGTGGFSRGENRARAHEQRNPPLQGPMMDKRGENC